MTPSGIGIEVGPTRLRALRLGRGRGNGAEAMEVEWGTPPPEESIRALGERFGTGNALAVALDMSVVFVKRVELPPLSPDERRRIIAMDPSRYFPVRDQALVAGVRDDDLVVAARESAFDTWIEALQALGSVERVEPAPASLIRHLEAHEMADGLLVLAHPGGGDATVARVAGRRLDALRKVPFDVRELVELVSAMTSGADTCVLFPWDEGLAGEIRARAGGAKVVPAPAAAGAPESFAVAHGALLGIEAGPDLTMRSASLERRIVAAGQRRAVLHGAGLLAALALLGWSVDHRREATLQALEERIEAVEEAAGPVVALRDEATTMAEELTHLAREASGRSNPLDVLLSVTGLLPEDAYLTHFSAVGDEWELNGLARDAARLVPLLEQSDLFSDVRFRTATTRVRIRNESFENFSLVFRHVPST
jgi:Tfp pilus assembly protein PilN